MDKITLEVLRSGKKRTSYELKYRKGMTVLDALVEVREKQDSSLAYRHSCRMGICGSCGMNIQGVPRLACQTQVSTLGKETVKVEPLHGMRVIRDLVVDIDPFLTMHTSVKPYLIRENPSERDNSDREYRVLSEEVGRFLQFDFCIMCGLCYSACPTIALDPDYLGPQAIAQAYRYMADPRDEGWEERVELLDRPHGVWRCHVAGSCSFVCPKDVDPAKAIQLARVEVLKKRFLRKKPRAGSPLVSLVPVVAPKQGTKAPPFDFRKGEAK
ncbi:MAG TPA: succinate dehydrogenase/fumarate reductase iron-sulfur subunit [Nitrososphaerales archaeon]|nr:succinate dehydrogenase/fumarate reductase iron-sulfur subunit [Nitrososphaerales archaeon]